MNKISNITLNDLFLAEIIIGESIYSNTTNTAKLDDLISFPEFFQRLSKTINSKEKCRFFKGWLESFIHNKITVTREWNFDIYPKITIIKHTNIKSKHKTRKQRK